MKKQIIISVLLFLTVSSIFPATVSAGIGAGTMDNERLIDVEKLRLALEKPNNEIAKRVEQTQLLEKFESATAACQDDQIDKEELVHRLEDLVVSIEGFNADFNKITDPLWDAQTTLSDTISKVQTLLARTSSGEPTEEIKKRLSKYDERLSKLAKSIKSEANPKRKAQNELLFKNILSMKKLYKTLGGLSLNETTEAMYIEVIGTLGSLELALTNSIFELERTRICLSFQKDFVADYTTILKGLIDAEAVSNLLKELANTSGGQFDLGLGKLQGVMEPFEKGITAAIQETNQSIKENTKDLIDGPDLGEDFDLDEAIDEYSKM